MPNWSFSGRRLTHNEADWPNNPLMKLRKKLLEHIGIQAEPEHVERASRYERVRRDVWLLVSTLISFGVGFGAVGIVIKAAPLTLSGGPGLLGLVPLFFATGIASVVDVHLFSWGVERWQITAPWQFREEIDGD